MQYGICYYNRKRQDLGIACTLFCLLHSKLLNFDFSSPTSIEPWKMSVDTSPPPHDR